MNEIPNNVTNMHLSAYCVKRHMEHHYLEFLLNPLFKYHETFLHQPSSHIFFEYECSEYTFTSSKNSDSHYWQ